MNEFIFYIQCSVLPQLKIWHWQTQDHSVHIALGDLYDSVVEAIDGIVESYQGRTQTLIKVDGSQQAAIVDFETADKAIEFLGEAVKQTMTQTDALRQLETFGDITNLLEELTGIFGRSMYLLTLK